MRRVFPQGHSPRQQPCALECETADCPTARLPLCCKRHRRRALIQIRTAANHADKQQAIDSYLFNKIDPNASAEHNAALLQKKLQEMLPCLSPVDAEQLSSHGQYIIQHVYALTKQKQQLQDPLNVAAATAVKAEAIPDHCQSLAVVQEYMLKAVSPEQGPVARLQSLAKARKQFEAALAFPKQPEWHEDLDAFMHKQARLGCRNSPTHSQHVAHELNHARLEDVTTIADRYFYNRVVAGWSPTANTRRLVLELQVLLPQLCDVAVMQRVQTRVDFFVAHMAQVCIQKEKDNIDGCKVQANSVGKRNRTKDTWQLVMHHADSEHYGTILVL